MELQKINPEYRPPPDYKYLTELFVRFVKSESLQTASYQIREASGSASGGFPRHQLHGSATRSTRQYFESLREGSASQDFVCV